MRFLDIIKEENIFNEKWLKNVNARISSVSKIPTDVYENPSPKDIRNIIQNSRLPHWPTIRLGIVDKPKPITYAWDGEIIHKNMKEYLKFDFGCVYEKKSEQIIADKPISNATRFDKLKNQQTIVKTIHNIFPKVDYMIVYTTGDNIIVNLKQTGD